MPRTPCASRLAHHRLTTSNGPPPFKPLRCCNKPRIHEALRILMKTQFLLACCALIGTSLTAADLSVPWFTIDGGGAVSSSNDGRFSVSGTTGQPDAGALISNDGRFRLNGGFWYAETVFCG